MKKLLFMLVALFILFIGFSRAEAVLITSEDFEGGATGWNDNTTTLGNSSFTRFLGRHADDTNSQFLFKTYTLSGDQTQVTIGFDFYEIDSWDNETFDVYIDNVVVNSDAFQHTSLDSPTNAVNLLGNGLENLDFTSRWSDQTYRYTLNVNTTSNSIKLGFGTSLDSGISDESWGIDNVIINDNAIVSEPIPEPATIALLGIGLVGLAGGAVRRRFKRKTQEIRN